MECGVSIYGMSCVSSWVALFPGPSLALFSGLPLPYVFTIIQGSRIYIIVNRNNGEDGGG